MIALKRVLMRLGLCAEVVLFFSVYFTSPSGFKAVQQLKSDSESLQHASAVLEHECAELKSLIDDWAAYPWYAEKIAREELQMIYPGEEIFLIDP